MTKLNDRVEMLPTGERLEKAVVYSLSLDGIIVAKTFYMGKCWKIWNLWNHSQALAAYREQIAKVFERRYALRPGDFPTQQSVDEAREKRRQEADAAEARRVRLVAQKVAHLAALRDLSHNPSSVSKAHLAAVTWAIKQLTPPA